jgi:uncharacterized protein (DUF849 family)
LGGDVRIGFENNTKSNDGTVFENNESSVETFVEAADKIGFKPKGANNE